ncbi:MAG: cupin domain-containing protein [Candidatus Binatia bacterium]
MRCLCVVLLALVLSACTAPRAGQLLRADPPRAVGFAQLARDAPLAPGQSIRPTEVARGEHSSVALVQIADRETPHVHTRYDLAVTLVVGSGTLWLDGVALPMQVGDAAFVPRGTAHYFVNAGAQPAAALVVFAPPFSGPDQEPAR